MLFLGMYNLYFLSPRCGLLGKSTNSNQFYRLEERRKVKSKAYYERKKAARRVLAKAEQGANVDSKTKTQLAQYGY